MKILFMIIILINNVNALNNCKEFKELLTSNKELYTNGFGLNKKLEIIPILFYKIFNLSHKQENTYEGNIESYNSFDEVAIEKTWWMYKNTITCQVTFTNISYLHWFSKTRSVEESISIPLFSVFKTIDDAKQSYIKNLQAKQKEKSRIDLYGEAEDNEQNSPVTDEDEEYVKSQKHEEILNSSFSSCTDLEMHIRENDAKLYTHNNILKKIQSFQIVTIIQNIHNIKQLNDSLEFEGVIEVGSQFEIELDELSQKIKCIHKENKYFIVVNGNEIPLSAFYKSRN